MNDPCLRYAKQRLAREYDLLTRPPRPAPLLPPEAVDAANRLVAQAYRTGKALSLDTIAERLARQGHRPPGRKRYSKNEVRAMLGGRPKRR